MKNKYFYIRSISLIITVVLLVSIFAACGKEDDEQLRVGMELAYPPFEMTDTDNKPAGLSVDFAKELGKLSGGRL